MKDGLENFNVNTKRNFKNLHWTIFSTSNWGKKAFKGKTRSWNIWTLFLNSDRHIWYSSWTSKNLYPQNKIKIIDSSAINLPLWYGSTSSCATIKCPRREGQTRSPQTFKMAKLCVYSSQLLAVNYCCKAFHCRCLQRSYLRFCA